MRPISCQTHPSPHHATAPLRLSLPRSGEDGAVRQGAASGACRMRVALIYFGLARSVLLTFDSIQAQVLAPNTAAGVTLRYTGLPDRLMAIAKISRVDSLFVG